ncbi:YdeI/OmpD-associated family protein [Chryseobacterium sp. JAH]|uniref:YdeI/OmpD-associated family protein n=1 Tax=Chryseobacterium sp. JAH TaxID=1742858 RepID=UPI0006486FED|nr:YdeI/OmpD-associated family protein [Chryseobacterium sp. JAH]KUJ52946.1 hypothetical protein AR685_00745 [Chryseobacterium sp. JAH]
MEKSHFKTQLEIIGINPFVFLPDEVLSRIFDQSGRDKSPIPVKGKVNGKDFKQNLMKYAGEWRLYINLTMLKDSPKRIGEVIEVFVEFDDSERTISIHPDLETAIRENAIAKINFDQLTPSAKMELIRYINNLKSEAAIQRNIEKILKYLLGETDFFGKRIK